MHERFLYGFCWLLLLGCKHKQTEDTHIEETEVRTPVTVTTIRHETLSDSITVNATSAFLQDNIVKSTINGYIKAVSTRVGQYTPAGKALFTLKTKEAESLGNTINKLDPSFHFTGVVVIKAPQSGFITQLLHQPGDYVQDGEQLAVISDSKSFGFVLNVPFEYRRYIALGKPVEVLLPDGTFLTGRITSFLPSLDSVSQTQQAVVRVLSPNALPENLVAKVRLVKSARVNTTTLPKEAVLTNESQTNFWVMKMIDSVTALKVPIIKGIETTERVEILSPSFTPADQILLTGQYGLPDTAKVTIVHQ